MNELQPIFALTIQSFFLDAFKPAKRVPQEAENN